MLYDEGCRTAVLGKTERTVGWEGDGDPATTGLLRHCIWGNPQRTARLPLPSLSHPFTLDGRYAMDTNAVENLIRPFCLGRRNWLFADTVAGANSSANLYSLIQTAKANGLEPYAYLRRVFTELPKAASLEHIEALLPTRIDPLALSSA